MAVAITHRLHANPGFVSLKATYPVGSRGGGNSSAWLLQLMRAQPQLPSQWGCYIGVTPAAAASAGLAQWKVDCLHFGNDTAAAQASIAPLRAAWDRFPSAGARWALAPQRSFWAWDRDKSGGDTTNVAAVLTSRIFPASAFTGTDDDDDGGGGSSGGSSGSSSRPSVGEGAAIGKVEALAAALTAAVHRGINLQIVLLLGGAAGGAHDNAVSSWLRQGLWHVVAASGWALFEPEALQQAAIERVRACGDELRELVRGSGAYLNENDWREPRWQASFFGEPAVYARLLAVKRALDPHETFHCRNCVGDNDTDSTEATAAAATAATAAAMSRLAGAANTPASASASSVSSPAFHLWSGKLVWVANYCHSTGDACLHLVYYAHSYCITAVVFA